MKTQSNIISHEPAYQKNSNIQQDREAWSFAEDPEMFALLGAICKGMLASSSSLSPGYEPGDLLSDVIWRLRNSRCPAAGAFVNLFRLSARSRMVEIYRSSQRRKRLFDEEVILNADPADDEGWMSPDFSAAWEKSDMDERRQLCREILELLSKLPVKIAQRPVLEAILEEASSGHRIPDWEIAEHMGITKNNVCKIRSEIRKRLSFLLEGTLGEEMPIPRKKCVDREKNGRNSAS